MSVYQTLPASTAPYAFPFKRTSAFKTISHEMENGVKQTRAKWGRERKTYGLAFRTFNVSEMDTLIAFFRARKGGADAFLFDDPRISSITGEAVGTGNGTTTVFAMANKYIQSATFKVYLAAVEQTTGFTLQDDAGTVTFAAAPGAGVAVTADYRNSVLVRFKADEMSEEQFAYRVFNSDAELEEVLL